MDNFLKSGKCGKLVDKFIIYKYLIIFFLIIILHVNNVESVIYFSGIFTWKLVPGKKQVTTYCIQYSSVVLLFVQDTKKLQNSLT